MEEGWISRRETEEVAKEYLLPLKEKGIDTLILACTHYPLLKNTISKIIGKKIKIVNPAKNLAIEFKNYLDKNLAPTCGAGRCKEIPVPEQVRYGAGKNQLKKGENHHFFFSDEPYNFKILSKLSLGKEIRSKIVNL